MTIIQLTRTQRRAKTGDLVDQVVDVVEHVLDRVDKVLQQSLDVIVAIVVGETFVGTELSESVLEAKKVGMERGQFIGALRLEVGRTT